MKHEDEPHPPVFPLDPEPEQACEGCETMQKWLKVRNKIFNHLGIRERMIWICPYGHDVPEVFDDEFESNNG